MTAKFIGVGIVALAAVGIYQAIASERRRRAAREEEMVTRWEGEGGALADAPAPPYEPRPGMVG